MHRRRFLVGSATVAAASVAGTALAGRVAAVEAGDGPYGPLAATPDAQGLLLPAGFASRVLAVSGQPVGARGYVWHTFPDGGACFPTGDGGWVYVSNSEVGEGTSGVGALVFGADGEVVDAYALVTGSSRNCAGGPTPWGTWLSGEEIEGGRVWECDPLRPDSGEVRPALGRFWHEAVAVDPDDERLYLTEDQPEGLFYRFTPEAYPDLSAGSLEAMVVAADGSVTWLPVPDPSAASAFTRTQVPEATRFAGGEGIWWRDGSVWFTTKGDHGIRRFDVAAQTLEVVYLGTEAEIVLGEPDNITMTAGGDLLICEDQAEDQQVVLLTPDGVIAPILQLTGQSGSELTGVAFDPSGTRLYVSSQRGNGGAGLTYEITGPFRGTGDGGSGSTTTTSAPATTGEAATSTVSPTTRALAEAAAGTPGGDDDGPGIWPVVGVGAALAAAMAYAATRLRARGAAGGVDAGPDHGGPGGAA